MSDVIILDHLKETDDEQFRKFIIAECRRIDRLDVYNWVADDELKIKQLQQENKQLKEKINTYEEPEDMTLMYMWCNEKAKDKIKQLKEVIDKANNELITLIQIIMEQPSENAVDDLWLLNRLESISIILDKVKEN